MVAFTSWYSDLADETRDALPKQLQRAARNLVRRRGFRTHRVARGKCRRVADDIKLAIDGRFDDSPGGAWAEVVSRQSSGSETLDGESKLDGDAIGPVC